MKKFIRLHNAEDNTIVIVNVEAIDLFDSAETKDGRKVTQIIHTNQNIDSFLVNESPDKIWAMLPDEYKTIVANDNK